MPIRRLVSTPSRLAARFSGRPAGSSGLVVTEPCPEGWGVAPWSAGTGRLPTTSAAATIARSLIWCSVHSTATAGSPGAVPMRTQQATLRIRQPAAHGELTLCRYRLTTSVHQPRHGGAGRKWNQLHDSPTQVASVGVDGRRRACVGHVAPDDGRPRHDQGQRLRPAVVTAPRSCCLRLSRRSGPRRAAADRPWECRGDEAPPGSRDSPRNCRDSTTGSRSCRA